MSIEFSLLAPYNERVRLVGAWNDWQPLDMEKDEEGWWRTSVDLDDGDHEYQFEVVSRSHFAEGETLRIADPRSVRMVGDDKSVVKVKGGQWTVVDHTWQHDDHPLPSNDELVIYELLVSDFSEKGTFEGVIEKLDYLADLGVNALQLMPVTEFPGEHSWGYNPQSLFAVEGNYGTPEDFARLVDECHGRGIRVILDIVFNHTTGEGPLSRIDFTYWFHEDNPDPEALQWGAKFNHNFLDEQHERWPAREFTLDSAIHWIEHFHIDGFRFDATYVIDTFDFLYLLRDTIAERVTMKPFIAIAEHVPEDPSVAGPEGPLDAAWYEAFSKQMMATIAGREQDGRQPYDVGTLAHVIDARNKGYASPRDVILYIDNHDQDRIMYQMGEAGVLDKHAFTRMRLGLAILMTAPGHPMLWMGQEFGQSGEKALEPAPLSWALLENDSNSSLLESYKALIKLRRDMPALHTEHIEILVSDSERRLLAYKRWNDEGQVIVMAANLDEDFEGEVAIDEWPGDGGWHEWTLDYDIEVRDGTFRDEFGPGEAKVYVKH